MAMAQSRETFGLQHHGALGSVEDLADGPAHRPFPSQYGRESFFSTTTAPLRDDDLDGFADRGRHQRFDSGASNMGRGRVNQSTSRPPSFFSPDAPPDDFDPRRPSSDFGSTRPSTEQPSGDWERSGATADDGRDGDASSSRHGRAHSSFGKSSPGAESTFTFPSASTSSEFPMRESRSSFYALDAQSFGGHSPASLPSGRHLATDSGSGSHSHSSHDHPRARYQQAPYAASRAASLYGIPSEVDYAITPAPILDQSHLQPGALASLLSHEKTLELYRANAKKTNDPDVQFEFCTFVMEIVGEIQADPARSEDGTGKSQQQALVAESVSLLSKLAHRGHVKSQYFLADCYTQGIGTTKGKRDYDKAYPLFLLAGKHGHADACFRAAQCCENGWGCQRAYSKAVSLLRRAAVLSHAGAMHRLGLAELNGELGLTKRPREGVKWLKRAAELADAVDPPQPQSLHELALLSEKGIDNVIFKDEEYAAELLARAAELQYAPSAYKLGECYEYGKMGCPQDSALSIHYYNIAAQQGHREACFALTAWYLVGSPGVLPQSDTEAYLWARKAADMGLAKAEYAVGYFTEVGIGTYKDSRDALEWFRKAANQGDKRARERLRLAAGGEPSPDSSFARSSPSSQQQQKQQDQLKNSSLPPPPPSSSYKPPPVTRASGKKTGGPPPRGQSADRARRSDPPLRSSSIAPAIPDKRPTLERHRSVSHPGRLNSGYVDGGAQNDPYGPPTSVQRQEYGNASQFRPIQPGQARMPNRQQRTESPVRVDEPEKLSTRDRVLQRKKAGDDKDCLIM